MRINKQSYKSSENPIQIEAMLRNVYHIGKAEHYTPQSQIKTENSFEE